MEGRWNHGITTTDCGNHTEVDLGDQFRAYSTGMELGTFTYLEFQVAQYVAY